MPHAPDTDAERWRDRARKIRNIAQGMHDPASKRTMLKTADDLEFFANLADASVLHSETISRSRRLPEQPPH
jgi:hypothetical protein